MSNLSNLSCLKCRQEMQPGMALVSTWVGSWDFRPGDQFCSVATCSPGGPGRMVQVMKCPGCGHSLYFGDAALLFTRADR